MHALPVLQAWVRCYGVEGAQPYTGGMLDAWPSEAVDAWPILTDEAHHVRWYAEAQRKK